MSISRWRTLIVIQKNNEKNIEVKIPGAGYENDYVISKELIPFEIKEGMKYLHAKVDLNAETSEELLPSDWEDK